MASLLDAYLGAGKDAATDSGNSSLLDSYLAPTGAPVAATPVESNVPTPEKFKQGWEAQGNKNPETPSLVSRAATSAIGLPVEYGSNVAENYKSGVSTAVSGLGDITSNNPATGVGKVGLGVLGAVISPISGAFKTLVEEPVTKLTGSKDIGERASFIAGAALPVAPATKAIKAAMPTNKATSAVIDTIGRDNLPSVIQELKSNDRLSLMDVVPATRQMAQKLITNEGPHQNKFEKFVTDRIGSAKGATTDIFDATMGTPVNVVDKINTLKQAAKDVGKNEIEPAVKGAGFVDVSNVINNIDAKLKPGVNSVITAGEPLALGDIEKPLAAVRQFIMDEKSVRTDPKSLHQFQSALRAKAEDMLNSTDGTTRQKGYALMNVRNDIVEAIDKASGGKYKPALSSFRDEKQVENAFNMGQLVTRNKLGRLEDSPEFWNNWVKGATPQELEAAREGARLAVQHQISGFKAGARKGQDIVESEFNKDKLSALFGKDEVSQMAKRLKDERNIAITNSKLIDNSQTAMRTKADSRVDLPVEKSMGIGAFAAPIGEVAAMAAGGYPGVATAAVGIAALGKKAKFKYADLPLAQARNSKITDLLTATGPERDELIKILESHVEKPKLSIDSKIRLSLPVFNP